MYGMFVMIHMTVHTHDLDMKNMAVCRQHLVIR